MQAALLSPNLHDVDRYAFGDLFLEDVRAYREERLSTWGKQGVWPIWGRDTRLLAREFVAAGFRGIVACLDPKQLDESFAGRELDESFFDELPAEVDPCGERGEFHTFVYDGPIFTKPVPIEIGEVVERDGFVFCDLLRLGRADR